MKQATLLNNFIHQMAAGLRVFCDLWLFCRYALHQKHEKTFQGSAVTGCADVLEIFCWKFNASYFTGFAPWFIPRPRIGPYTPMPFLSVDSCHLSLFPVESNSSQILLDFASPVCPWQTPQSRFSLEALHLPV